MENFNKILRLGKLKKDYFEETLVHQTKLESLISNGNQYLVVAQKKEFADFLDKYVAALIGEEVKDQVIDNFLKMDLKEVSTMFGDFEVLKKKTEQERFLLSKTIHFLKSKEFAEGTVDEYREIFKEAISFFMQMFPNSFKPEDVLISDDKIIEEILLFEKGELRKLVSSWKDFKEGCKKIKVQVKKKYKANTKSVISGKFLGCSTGHKAIVFKRGSKKFKNPKGDTFCFEEGYLGKCAGCKKVINAGDVLKAKKAYVSCLGQCEFFMCDKCSMCMLGHLLTFY